MTDSPEGRIDTTGEMSLLEHLQELRSRLIKSVAAVVVCAIVVAIFQEPLFDFLSEPYCNIAETDEVVDIPGGFTEEEWLLIRPENKCSFLVTDPLGEFNVLLTLAGYGGVILALPFVLYQMARFVLPGLYPHEKRLITPFIVASVLLLLTGLVVGYLFLPRALDVLGNIGSDRFESNFTPNNYLSFFIKMVLAFGLAFELPIALIFLQVIGVLPTAVLRRNRRIAVVAIVVLGAVITPTGDPFTLVAVSVPMYVFFEVAVLIGGRMTRQRPAEVGS